MKAAYYNRQGLAAEVLQIGELPEVLPGTNEVQIEIHYSGVNPGEVKKRSDAFGMGMPYPTVIPHSDGAGFIRKVGDGVSEAWMGKKVLCFGAQSYRPFGTAAAYCCVPVNQVLELSEKVDLAQAAQMGIPGITAHRAIHVGDTGVRRDRANQLVLVQGGSGAVGQCAIAIAKMAEARVLATVRKEADIPIARSAGADDVYLSDQNLKQNILSDHPQGVDHIVEVAFAANIQTNAELLRQGGSIATYASNQSPASIPFWPLVFMNVSVFFLGSDDFSLVAKQAAVQDLTEALSKGWQGLPIGQVYKLDQIAEAHLHVENKLPGRALIKVKDSLSQ